MKKFNFILLSFFLCIPLLYSEDSNDPKNFKNKHEQMLYTVARVRTGISAGSGTIIWSGKEKDGWHTYILTNHHVIKSAISIKTVWDSRLGRQIKKEFRSTVTVEFFKYNNYSRNVGVQAVQADVRAYDEKEDIALLETRDRENQLKHVAKIFPLNNLSEVKIYDRLYAVGAALGHAPISTEGMLNFMDDEIDDLKYWMSSAQIIFGNSGGAMFRWSNERGQYEWIGIPSRVSVQGWGTAVTHMGYFIPISRVINFLNSHNYRFILSEKYKWEEEKEIREKEKEIRDKSLILREYISEPEKKEKSPWD